MSRAQKITSWIAVTGIIIISLKYFLLDTSSVPAQTDFTIDLSAVRKLAGAAGKPLPVSLNCIATGEAKFPATGVIAGSGFADHFMVFTSFQVMYPDRSSVVIDTSMSKPKQEEMFSGNPYHSDRWNEMQSAMKKALQILATHEHEDHIGGIAEAPDFDAIKDRVVLTEEQVSSPFAAKSHFPAGALASLHPLKYDRMISPAPGIVLIKTPGHSAGSQIIYVQLKNSEEFLFIGDIAWSMLNIEKLTGRPLLLSLFLQEDRKVVAGQIRYLYNLIHDQKEKIHVVSAHDLDQYRQLIKDGYVHEGFSL